MPPDASALETLRAETIAALTPTLTADQRQVVFGIGDPSSSLMLVGEAPGPQEDKQGEPFVGPSGALLNAALAELGLRREQLWISNVVKVWPNKRAGRSLTTRPPNAAESKASRPFFDREVGLIRPQVIVCLGGTAAQAVIDKKFKITAERGEWRRGPLDIPALATYHPSYILRLQGAAPDSGVAALQAFKADLHRAAIRAGLLPDEPRQGHSATLDPASTAEEEQ